MYPDLSARPLRFTVASDMIASPEALYRAWTEEFDAWFAAPGTLTMKAQVGRPFFFETHFDGQRHPHYGRFLKLDPDRLIELTWLTGNPGTLGAETIITVEIEPRDGGSSVRLTHAGFYDEDSMHGHEGAWSEILVMLDEKIAGGNKE